MNNITVQSDGSGITVSASGPQGIQGPAGSGALWGGIGGTLADQTDLQTAQDAQDTSIALNTSYIGMISGVISGMDVSVNGGDSSKFDISAGTGIIIDYSTPTAPVITSIAFAGVTAVTVTNLATEIFTSLYIDINGDLQQLGGAILSAAQIRQNISLDAVIHDNFTTITNIAVNSVQSYQGSNALFDYVRKLGPINDGNAYSSGGANLTVSKAAGTTTLPWINRNVDAQNPTESTNPVIAPLTSGDWTESYRDGSGGFVFAPLKTVVKPDLWDDGSGVLATVSNNKYTIKRFYFFGQNNQTITVFGQAEYSSLVGAQSSVFTENPVLSPLLATGTFVSALIIKKGVTDLNSAISGGTALFVNITFQTSAAGGGLGSQDLQNTYDLSTQPQILTDASKMAFQVQQGSGADTDNIYEGANGAGTVTFCVTGDGDIQTHTLDVIHTALMADDHALEIDANADGFGDVKAVDIAYITGAIGSGSDEAIMLVNIDETLATGGDISALEVLSTEGGADKITGLFVGVGIGAIEQLVGDFADFDSIDDNGADVTTALSTGGAGNIAIFTNNNETVTVGKSIKFEEMEMIFDTGASNPGVSPTFEFSTGVGTWAAFTPVDGTNGMRNTGVIAWIDGDIPSWAVGTGSEYLIRITRTRNSLGTSPIVDLIKGASAVERSWDKDGNVNISDLTLSPSASITPTVNGEMTFEATSNTLLTIKLKGTDGTVREGTITLS